MSEYEKNWYYNSYNNNCSDHKYIPLKELDEDYSLEEAINDQLIIFENRIITHGQQQ